MKNYNLDEYDFNDDENFQKFFRRHISDENIERDKFTRKLNYCKREWIRILNSPVLRYNYNRIYNEDI